jgi:hypothetical protein
VETGPTRFGDDWTGVFIRGDNAGYYAMNLQNALSQARETGGVDGIPCAVLQGLVELLQASDHRGMNRAPVVEKRYTIKELLGSEEAMKDLLQERVLAARDDLNFAINVKMNNLANNVNQFAKAINSLESSIKKSDQAQLDQMRDMVSGLDMVREEMSRRWWRTLYSAVRGRCSGYWEWLNYRDQEQ